MKTRIEKSEGYEKWLVEKNGKVLTQLILEVWPFYKTKPASFAESKLTSIFEDPSYNKKKLFFLSRFEVSKECTEQDLNRIFTLLLVYFLSSYARIRFLLLQMPNRVYGRVCRDVNITKFTTEVVTPPKNSHRILLVKNSIRNISIFYRLIFRMNWNGYALIDHRWKSENHRG